MNEFVFLYRMKPETSKPSAQLMQERMTVWMTWLKGLEAKGHMVSMGHPLADEGRVVKDKSGGFVDGPYAETKDVINGYSIVRAKDLAEAAQLAAGCPAVGFGGVVEVRPIAKMG